MQIADYHIGGSVGINGIGNDVDLIVLLHRDCKLTFGMLNNRLWSHCGEESYESAGLFDAYRLGLINVILTDDEEYYKAWKVAKALCQRLAALGHDTREYRVMVHTVVCDLVGVE